MNLPIGGTKKKIKSLFGGITVALSSFGDSPEAVERTFEGIGEQIYVDHDQVQLVFVDAGTRKSPENTPARKIAEAYGAEIGSVAVGSDFRPRMLNTGLRMAAHPHVVSMPAHAVPATNVMLAAGKRQFEGPNGNGVRIGGVYGVLLPDENVSWVEQRGAHYMGQQNALTARRRRKSPVQPAISMPAVRWSINA
jgi:hypothetical protein